MRAAQPARTQRRRCEAARLRVCLLEDICITVLMGFCTTNRMGIGQCPFPEDCECETYVRLAGGLTEERGGSIQGLLSGLSEVEARIVMRKVHAGDDHLPVLVRRVDNCNGLEQQRTGKLRKFNL